MTLIWPWIKIINQRGDRISVVKTIEFHSFCNPIKPPWLNRSNCVICLCTYEEKKNWKKYIYISLNFVQLRVFYVRRQKWPLPATLKSRNYLDRMRTMLGSWTMSELRRASSSSWISEMFRALFIRQCRMLYNSWLHYWVLTSLKKILKLVSFH